MKKKILVVLGILIFSLVCASAEAPQLNAQSASDAMAKSKDAEKRGRQAFDNGFYEDAIILADEATAYAHMATLWFRAGGLVKQAENRVLLALRYKTDVRDPSLYKNASELYATANGEYKNKEFEPSIANSLRVIELLKDITPPPAVAEPPKEKTYTVKKKIPADCFWRIAGYPEIYNDASKWPLIYRANQQKLQDPENPDLIQPGMVLVIPPLKK